MGVIWCGGEDIDFASTGSMPSAETSSSYRRSGYSRCALHDASQAYFRSTTFPGGEITSGWLGYRHFDNYYYAVTTALIGFCKAGSYDGLYIGVTSSYLEIWKISSGTPTVLATQSEILLQNGIKLDLRLQSYGASGTLTLYKNGVEVCSYNGDISIGGITGFDQVSLRANYVNHAPAGYRRNYSSEIIVAEEDTRNMSLITLYPNAAGDAMPWTGAYSDIDETAVNDEDSIYTDTAEQDAQVNVSDNAPGLQNCKGVKIASRAAKSTDASIGSLAQGIKSGGTVSVDGTPDALTTAWETYDHLMLVNPVTSNPFTLSELNALQLNFRSKS